MLSNRPVVRKKMNRSESFSMDKKKKRRSLQIFHRRSALVKPDNERLKHRTGSEEEDLTSSSDDEDTKEKDSEEAARRRFEASLDLFASRKNESFHNLKKVITIPRLFCFGFFFFCFFSFSFLCFCLIFCIFIFFLAFFLCF